MIISLIILSIIVLYVVFIYKREFPGLKKTVVEIPEEVYAVAENNGHRLPDDFAWSVYWAHKTLTDPEKYVVLDTETTGINNQAVIIQIAVTDLHGNELLNTLIKPSKKKRMPADAKAVHGINMEALHSAPYFRDIISELSNIIDGKTVLIYNAEYDQRLIEQTCKQDEVYDFYLSRAECVMEKYSAFKGVWSDYHGDYRYQKLPNGDHSAIGDCLATLRVIEEMASIWPVEDKDEFV